MAQTEQANCAAFAVNSKSLTTSHKVSIKKISAKVGDKLSGWALPSTQKDPSTIINITKQNKETKAPFHLENIISTANSSGCRKDKVRTLKWKLVWAWQHMTFST